MGGVINVAIRFRDGRTICQERWTNNMPHWFKDPKMHLGDEAHVQAYIDLTKDNDYIENPNALGSPMPVEDSEYGLIVWDYVTNTILDNNGYSDPITFDPIYTGGENPREGFFDCADAGMIRMRTRTYEPYAEFKARADGGYMRELSVELTDPLSPEEARRLGEKVHSDERGSWRGPSNDKLPKVVVDFVIDSPMTYCQFNEPSYDEDTEEYVSDPAYLAKLKEIGFPLTVEEGLNATPGENMQEVVIK